MLTDASIGILSDEAASGLTKDIGGQALYGGMTGECMTCAIGLPSCGMTEMPYGNVPVFLAPFDQPKTL